MATVVFGQAPVDSLPEPQLPAQSDSLVILPEPEPAPKRDFLEAPVTANSNDSLVYDVRNRLIFIYGQGDVTYENNNLKADKMILNVASKEVFGVGVPDSLGVMSRPEFIQGRSNYTMDTITYNLDSRKAKIKGVATKDGEGYLLGRDLKKMPDNTINIAGAKYTTCDVIEHPHFYIAMTKAKVIPGKKIITGPAYFVMEDVPIYFLGIPGGFFPITAGPQSGIVMPTYGEETRRGFYLRDGGYYFTFGDYADLELTGSIYTLGSWGLKASSNYMKRYKFSGSVGMDYERVVLGERNSTDYQNTPSFKINWSHRQDPKASPGRTFSASVNFATSGYRKQATTSLQDHLATQTNSSISYSRMWKVGSTSINLTANVGHSSNSVDSSLMLTLPSLNLTVSSFAPFKRRVQAGEQKWYEKITMSYSMQARNSVKAKESTLFTKKTLEDMSNGVTHRIPIQTSFTLFDYINFAPSFNYEETWNFKRERMIYNPDTGKVDPSDPEFGFFRTYSWNVAGSFSTKFYGMYEMKNKEGWLQAVRHVVTPTVGFSYAPDFRDPRYGFVDYYQTNEAGRIAENPNYYMGEPRGRIGSPSASINFSLSNQIEAKVRSRADTTGLKKIPFIEQLSASGSYNFMADSMRLSPISLTLRTGTLFKNFAIQLNATWDPYVVLNVNGNAVPTGKYNIGKGKFGRIASTSWTFGYTFNSSDFSQPVMNDINSGAYIGAYTNPYDPSLNLDPTTRRQYLVSAYYDFSIPWNFGFNYSINYSNRGLRREITQTLGFNGSVTLTKKWGFTFNGGFDIAARRFTPMQISVTRDLHCWNMSFQWIPLGMLKSYSFHIGIRSGMLRDIKYDKQSSRYDNLLE